MSFEILESDIDVQIKNNLQKFVDGDYIGSFTEEENEHGLKLSFLFNHASIDKLVFSYGGLVLKISIDNSFLKRETYFKYMW